MGKNKKTIKSETVETRAKVPVSSHGGFVLSGPTRSGQHVTETTAMGLSALWCGVRTISQDLGCLEPRVYSEDSYGVRKLEKKHPLDRLLTREVNPEMSGLIFRETMQANAILHGAAYAEIVRAGDGRPVELWPIHPQFVQPYRDTDTGALSYKVTVTPQSGIPGAMGMQVEIPSHSMLVINGLSPDGSVGWKLLSIARESLGFGLATQAYGASFYRNACRPGGTLETPVQLSQQARENLRESYQQLYAGTDNVGRLMLLEEGLKFAPLQLTNEQSQFKDILNWWVYEVARFLVISPTKLFSLDKATWANLTELNRDYLNTTLRPWLERWESEIERKLLLPGERDDLYVEFDTSTLLRADEATRYTNYSTALAGKQWRTINEIRAAENLPPVERGDTLDSVTPEPEPEPAPATAEAEPDATTDAADSPPNPTPEAEADVVEPAENRAAPVVELAKDYMNKILDKDDMNKIHDDHLEANAA